MAKFVFWIITLIGLLPSLLLFIGMAYASWSIRKSDAMRRYHSVGEVYFHDFYFSLTLGSQEIAVYPRIWVLVLIGVGIFSLIIGLICLLHVPQVKFFPRALP